MQKNLQQTKALHELLNIQQESDNHQSFSFDIQQQKHQSKTLDNNLFLIFKNKNKSKFSNGKSLKDLINMNKAAYQNKCNEFSNKQSLKDLLLKLESKQITSDQTTSQSINMYFNTIDEDYNLIHKNIQTANKPLANRYSIVFKDQNKNKHLRPLNNRIRLPFEDQRLNVGYPRSISCNYGHRVKQFLEEHRCHKTIQNKQNNISHESQVRKERFEKVRHKKSHQTQNGKNTYKKKLYIKYSRLSNKQNQNRQSTLVPHHQKIPLSQPKNQRFDSISKKTFQILQQINLNRSIVHKANNILHSGKKGSILRNSVLETGNQSYFYQKNKCQQKQREKSKIQKRR